ncbi:hypothetical protein [Aquisphaera insulae]|uniref:hypothetical protein n=1 Tax=Aquisphaera insulae TaxID=2712864 RepID=UPI0013ECB070|nr:hypothetical protein [Aquisphaera insulae]
MVDGLVIALAVFTLVAVTRRLHPARPIPVVILTGLSAAWTWANLRDPGWEEVWIESAPRELNPITRALFYRGWPLAPFMLCIIHGNRFRPDGFESWAMVIDRLVLLAALWLARLGCDRLAIRNCDHVGK